MKTPTNQHQSIAVFCLILLVTVSCAVQKQVKMPASMPLLPRENEYRADSVPHLLIEKNGNDIALLKRCLSEHRFMIDKEYKRNDTIIIITNYNKITGSLGLNPDTWVLGTIMLEFPTARKNDNFNCFLYTQWAIYKVDKTWRKNIPPELYLKLTNYMQDFKNSYLKLINNESK